MHRKITWLYLKTQRTLVSARLLHPSPSWVWELFFGRDCWTGQRAYLLSWLWGCCNPADTWGHGLVAPHPLWLRGSLTCGFAQLQLGIVKAFLRSGEQRAALWHGPIIKKSRLQRGMGWWQESLLIHTLTWDLSHAFVIARQSVQEAAEKLNYL